MIEESGELGQVLGKLIATGGETDHYDGTDLRLRMIEEIGDLRAALKFFAEENDLDIELLYARESDKLQLFRRWHSEGLT